MFCVTFFFSRESWKYICSPRKGTDDRPKQNILPTPTWWTSEFGGDWLTANADLVTSEFLQDCRWGLLTRAWRFKANGITESPPQHEWWLGEAGTLSLFTWLSSALTGWVLSQQPVLLVQPWGQRSSTPWTKAVLAAKGLFQLTVQPHGPSLWETTKGRNLEAEADVAMEELLTGLFLMVC